MIRPCCGREHVGDVCLDGLVMCCLCFQRFPYDCLGGGPDGLKWNICVWCHENRAADRRR